MNFSLSAIAIITSKKEYIFRSFWDREDAFKTLKQCQQESNNNGSAGHPHPAHALAPAASMAPEEEGPAPSPSREGEGEEGGADAGSSRCTEELLCSPRVGRGRTDALAVLVADYSRNFFLGCCCCCCCCMMHPRATICPWQKRRQPASLVDLLSAARIFRVGVVRAQK